MFKVNNKDKIKLTKLTYFNPCSSVSILNFEQVNADWVTKILDKGKADTFSLKPPEKSD